ncbi:hypothetical protein ACIOMQ_39010 [Streptomyces sp. NPDC087845]|uniref:hypothetical protein n=1 Tax=Streptomyces sp. NPDC087845 TaxID=3365806 RepID=UPI00380446B4
MYGHLLKDRSTMYDLTSHLELTATSEDSRVLDALGHARRYKTSRDYIPERHENGRTVDISFATLNWQKTVRDKNRPGAFVRKHFEAMVFAALAEELRTGDVAVASSEEYADWSEQLLPWEDVEAKLGAYLLEVGLAEPRRRGAVRRGRLPTAAGGQLLEQSGRGARVPLSRVLHQREECAGAVVG